MSAGLSWRDDGRDWPNREFSRFVEAGGLRWHVQFAGQGPVVLLLHGTGASSHSWRDLLPLLAVHATVVSPDLPGHGFTASPHDAALSLPGMARAVTALLRALEVTPDLVVGHSAGAAIAIRMALDAAVTPRALISLNGALRPFGGAAASLFPTLARLLVLNPFVPRLFAWRARDPSAVIRLIEGTGSRIDRRGLALYGRLFSSRAHVEATLAMMANWDLAGLERSLTKLAVPLVLVAGEGDLAVPPRDAETVAARVPGASVRRLKGVGHLMHEEAPEQLAEVIVEVMHAHGLVREAAHG